MANRTKTAGVSDGRSSVVIQDHQTDSPTLPVSQMERLYRLDPEFAKFYTSQTKQEADYRRARDTKNDKRVFFTRTAGQISAFLIAIVSILGGCYLIYSNPDIAYAGAIVAVVPVSGLATTLVIGRRQ